MNKPLQIALNIFALTYLSIWGFIFAVWIDRVGVPTQYAIFGQWTQAFFVLSTPLIPLFTAWLVYRGLKLIDKDKQILFLQKRNRMYLLAAVLIVIFLALRKMHAN